ncbi:MAG: hypothetical protein RBS37_08390 [Bacteroidales bacterium]|jgi:hypothetical protein|nr:hypothetical protein [Bacteroidales bacterium]
MNNHNEKKSNPFMHFGFMLIALGLILLAATLDLFGWGSMHAYVRWEMLPVFIGLNMLFKGNFTGAILLLALGAWFMLPDIWPGKPEMIRVAFWPAVLILTGITFLLPSPRKYRGRGKIKY